MLDTLSGIELRRFLDTIGAPMFVVDVEPSGGFIYRALNRSCERFTGFNERTLVGRGPDDVLPPEQASEVKEHFRRCIARGDSYEFEQELEVPAGTRCWRVVVNPVIDGRGNTVRLLGTAVDITDEKQAQAQLRYQHVLLNAQQELTPDGVLVAGIDGRLHTANSRFRDIWNLSEEIISRGREHVFPEVLSQLTNPASFKQQVEALYQNLQQTIQGAELELRDGRVLEWYSRGLVDHEQIGHGRIWYFRDVTERKRVERQLRRALTLQRTILNSTAQAILSVDTDGVIRTFNQAAERMLGYQAEEVIGKMSPFALHDPEEVEQRRQANSKELGRSTTVDELFHAPARRGEYLLQEWTYVRKDGSRLPVELSLTPVQDEDGSLSGYLAVATDISERKAQEARLRELAATDELTGLANRRHFLELSGAALRRARRYGEQLYTLLLDVDQFKRLNDEHGHDAGDKALLALAGALNHTLRDSDLLCRWGGEEFAVLLMNSDDERALEAAERLRAAVEALELEYQGQRVRLTISIGLADWLPDESGLNRAMQVPTKRCTGPRTRAATGSVTSCARTKEAGKSGRAKRF